ncbi:MAG TPA: class I SAM-dependent methyltransferase [Thermoanaerobaculia bacterium]|jgi:tRNA (mo5U34)-methyltransferase
MAEPITDIAEVRRLVAEHGRWWHEIEVAPGVVTPGDDSNRMKLPILEELGLPASMTGLRALDIGCSDGYFAFELERRGAEVVAIDFVPETYSGFATARRILGSAVEYRMDNVYNLSPESYGLFDVVLFLGVLYHLRKPQAALDTIRSVMRPGAQMYLGTMLIDEYFLLPDGSVTSLAAVNPVLREVPLWQAYPGDVLNGDFTNCFAPNLRGLEVALAEAELRVERTRVVGMGGYARASAVVDAHAARYQRLDGRLESTPFDPDVPYFLDEPGSTHTVTPPRHGTDRAGMDSPPVAEVRSAASPRRRWWQVWK